ncbi:MAG TPA: tetratricopeptide repeat protein [Vicinamibacterales bacterium]|jgi:TolB-like protein/Flp pilus assembly protein TadD|nr:tetratricopeptide repeat protein [Vicinamibacterales bacterium]
MGSRSSVPATPVLQDQAVLEHLERILASPTFQQGDRLKRFLKFIVVEAVAGRRHELKEYVIGVEVFGKEETFDPRTDPIVRVQARRLRAKLVRYYRDEGRADETVIELPKGGYAPVFKHRDTPVLIKRTVAAALVSRNTVAVLPFADHSGERDLDYFCRGMREEIVHHLARFPSLRILASDEPRTTGNKTDAAMIINGSVRRSGERLRITAQLVDGATGCYIWSESVDATLIDLFPAQERVAAAIAARIEPELGDGRPGSPSRKPNENLAAHNLYLQGRYHLNQRTEEGLRKALDFFEKSLVEDAEYAAAHAGLSDAYGLLAHYGVFGPAEVWTKAAASATAAVLLDANSAEAHTSLAHVKATQDWDWLGAEREFQRAISLDPRCATSHHWYAMSCLSPLGRLDEALDEMIVAQALDPVSSIVARDLAVIHFYRRDFETALEQCDHTVELNPHFAPAYWILGVIQEQRQDFDESAAAFQRAVHLSPQTPRMHGALGRTFALSGRRKRALDVLRKLEAYAKERYVSPLEFAWIQFALGEIDLGFYWMQKALEDRSFDLISIKVDPRFDTLKHDPRFEVVVRRIGVVATI